MAHPAINATHPNPLPQRMLQERLRIPWDFPIRKRGQIIRTEPAATDRVECPDADPGMTYDL